MFTRISVSHWVLATFALSLPPAAVGTAADKEPTIQLVLSLQDGSRLIGTIPSALRSLDLSTEAVGKVHVSVGRINTIEFNGTNQEATVILQNGDKLQGVVELRTLKLATMVGELAVPMKIVSRLEVRQADNAVLGGRLTPEDWDILPYASDSDWPGPKGERARFNNGEVLLAGQPIRSRSAFVVPTTLDCDVTLEDQDAPDASFFVRFVQPGQSKDLDPTRSIDVVLTRVGQNNEGIRFQLTVVVLNGSSHGNVAWTGPTFTLKPGVQYHLRVHALSNGLRIELNDAQYEVNDNGTRIPDGKFQIQFWSWRPGVHWRVSDLAVH